MKGRKEGEFMEKERSVGKEFAVGYFHFGKLIDKKLEQSSLNLKKGQVRFLLTIHRNEGMTQKELGGLLRVEKATTAKAVRKLIELGYVYKNEDELDRRNYRLYLTEQGKQAVPTLLEIRRNINNQALKDFTEKEKETFFAFLDRINNHLIE